MLKDFLLKNNKSSSINHVGYHQWNSGINKWMVLRNCSVKKEIMKVQKLWKLWVRGFISLGRLSVRSPLLVLMSGSGLRIRVDSWKKISGLPHLCFVQLLSWTLDGMMVKKRSNCPLPKVLIEKCCSSVAAGLPAHLQPFPNAPKPSEDSA